MDADVESGGESDSDTGSDFAFPADDHHVREFSSTWREAPVWYGSVDTYQKYKREVALWKDTAAHLTNTNVDDNRPSRTGLLLAQRILGGRALTWREEHMDQDKLRAVDGETDLFRELDKIYLRDKFD